MLRAYSKIAGRGKLDGVDYATTLLATFPRVSEEPGPDRHPALAWAASGAMALTGEADGPPVLVPGGLAVAAGGALRALAALANDSGRAGTLDRIDGAALLGERAALLGLSRGGTVSPGGSCRLLRARDGWIAVNLARPDDVASIPAWLGRTPGADPWDTVADAVATRRAEMVVARAHVLGLAAAVATAPPAVAPEWVSVLARVARPSPPARRPALVVDLSSLWAGPLATSLLAATGARVVKVESTRRPDGARLGSAPFFDLLNGGKESVALDFRASGDRAALHRLLARADIVVESARPRALEQLCIHAAKLVARRPGLTWVSITGYGRSFRAADLIAFGDDAGVAAGLAVAAGRAAGDATTDGRVDSTDAARVDTPLFCGDAIADPLTGLHAAVAALAGWQRGGGLLALALRDVAAYALAFGPPADTATMRPYNDGGTPGWAVAAQGRLQPVLPPRARSPMAAARPLGADTDTVLRELAHG